MENTQSIIEISSAYITGYTTIYPIVKRADGNDLTVTLSIADNYSVFAKASEETVKGLGQRINTVVGLTGFAKWECESYKIVEFKIDQILEYQQTSIRESFDKVREVLGEYYDSVNNINQLLYRDDLDDYEWQ